MRGNLIIGRNHAFYNINNNLIKVNINGNNNKVVNPFRIKNLYIHGNNNNIEVIENGEINFVKFFGHNNKIHLKNNSICHYEDHGNGNLLIKKENLNTINIVPFQFQTNLNFFNINGNNNNNDNRDNRVNNLFNNLEEHLYSELPIFLKINNSDKCSLCSRVFNANEKIKIYPCKKHIFHSNCLKEFLRNYYLFNINPAKCPKCSGNNDNALININAVPYIPRYNFNFRNRRRNLRSIFDNNHANNSRHSAPIFDDSSDDENFDDFGDGDIIFDENDSDSDFMFHKGLNKEILDNMEISKIKDVEKLDNDKKKCTICLEEYVNGDDSIALPCIHIFHADCIKTWLKNQNTCPICKFEIKYDMDDMEDMEDNENNIF